MLRYYMANEEHERNTRERDDFYELNKHRLAELAMHAIKRGTPPVDFAVVCIDVDDPSWTEVVDYLMPGADWNQFRSRGEKPVARGTVNAPFLDYLCDVAPDVAAAKEMDLQPGFVRVAVMGCGGVSLYMLNPAAELNLN